MGVLRGKLNLTSVDHLIMMCGKPIGGYLCKINGYRVYN